MCHNDIVSGGDAHYPCGANRDIGGETSLPWKIADLDAQSGSSWVVIGAESQFTLGDLDANVRYEILDASLGWGSVSVPADNYTDVYHGEFTTGLTISDSSGVIFSRMTSIQESWIADGVESVSSNRTSRQPATSTVAASNSRPQAPELTSTWDAATVR